MSPRQAHDLPQREAHAVYALLTAAREHKMPVTASEVLIFDEMSLSASSTGDALRRARKRGLCVNAGRLWVPTHYAHELYSDLEERFLMETER